MGSSTRRIPFVLNLDDPLDAAIWEALEPMLARHRASSFIRGAVAQVLGIGTTPILATAPPSPRALSAGEQMMAKRPKQVNTSENSFGVSLEDDDENGLEAAANNFLNAFG